MRLPAEAWNAVEWREGSNQPLSSRFAAARVRPASRDHKLVAPHPVEWLVVEWPEGEVEPTKYWLSTLPEDMPLAVLVDVIKLRWRIERDYEELKSELDDPNEPGAHCQIHATSFGAPARASSHSAVLRDLPPSFPESAKLIRRPYGRVQLLRGGKWRVSADCLWTVFVRH